MKKILLYFHTIKYLKFSQIFFRIYKNFVKPKISDSWQSHIVEKPNDWLHIDLYEEKIDEKYNSFFLNHQKKLNFPNDWHSNYPNKLWAYNLHYFDELLSHNSHDKHSFHNILIERWIDENPFSKGIGWEPYPTSLRIINTLKAWLGGLKLNKNVMKNIFIQSSYLSNNLERHLLGNHYFVNLKALIFAGIIFDKERWLSLSQNKLRDQIMEQILDDGANFELSPMYHSIMLVDCLDIYNLSRAFPKKISNELKNDLETCIPKMMKFLECMSHPDGGLSFFNDSVDGIAPTKAIIENYAKRLGFKKYNLDLNNISVKDNIQSGYFSATSSGNKLIFDAGNIGPDYIPGHAHADTLSFEFSIGSERVFVNRGISEYELTQNRLIQRKTLSHNTIEIDGRDSSQVWSSFRVAKRAKIIERSSKIKNQSKIILKGSHNGYSKILNKCIHSRKLTLNKNSLEVMDQIYGKFTQAKAFFYIHPEIDVSISDDILKLLGRDFILESSLQNIDINICDSEWSPSFGINIPNKLLEITLKNNISILRFEWKKIV